MVINTIFNSFHLIGPEIAVALLLLAVVIFDLAFPKNKKFLPWLTIAGIIVAGFLTVKQYSLESGFVFESGNTQGLIVIDNFAFFFKLLILGVSLLIILFSVSSEELKNCYDRAGEYYTLITGMILGMFFMVSTVDLITLYISIELVSFSSYVLAGFIKKSKRSSEAGLKYIIYGAVASGIMLFGISLVFGYTGTTNFYQINHIVVHSLSPDFLLSLAFILIFVGFGYKISAVPFHFWTPDVYEGAPTTITAYLSVASKAAGFALLIRFVKIIFFTGIDENGYWILSKVFNWSYLLIIISVLTMTVGNFAALWQNNVKRMLAYSSIAHAGYMLAALTMLSEQGLLAIVVYFVVYGLTNLGAFYIVLLIHNKTGSEEIDDYDALGYQMPLMGVAMTILLVSLTGLPPTAGFNGKLYVFISILDAPHYTLAVIVALNSVVSLYYYVRIIKHLYLNNPKVEREFTFPVTQTILVLVLTIPVIILGLYFGPLLEMGKVSLRMFGF